MDTEAVIVTPDQIERVGRILDAMREPWIEVSGTNLDGVIGARIPGIGTWLVGKDGATVSSWAAHE